MAEASMVLGPLTALAPAKINLGLFVGPRREDSRHELVTVMQSVSLADELELRQAPAGAAADEVRCPGVSGPNLAASALEIFRATTGWDAPPLLLTITKHVPVAGGMGGGSGDAAAALRLCAAASGLATDDALRQMAARLGSDVPAQVRPGRWLATGAGEVLRPLPDPTPGFGVLVLPVDAELSTGAVYVEADRLGRGSSAEALRRRRDELEAALGFGRALPRAELLANQLQAAALALCPAIGGALAQARDAGADAVLVSGSGPTVLGLFQGANVEGQLARALNALADRAPAPLTAGPVGASFGDPTDLEVRHN